MCPEPLGEAPCVGRPVAARWNALEDRRHQPQVRGNIISMRDATAAGRAVFGDVLTQR